MEGNLEWTNSKRVVLLPIFVQGDLTARTHTLTHFLSRQTMHLHSSKHPVLELSIKARVYRQAAATEQQMGVKWLTEGQTDDGTEARGRSSSCTLFSFTVSLTQKHSGSYRLLSLHNLQAVSIYTHCTSVRPEFLFFYCPCTLLDSNTKSL